MTDARGTANEAQADKPDAAACLSADPVDLWNFLRMLWTNGRVQLVPRPDSGVGVRAHGFVILSDELGNRYAEGDTVTECVQNAAVLWLEHTVNRGTVGKRACS